MTDLQSRISGVVLNRLADYGIRIDREVSDSVAEAVMGIPGMAITQLPAPYHDGDTYQSWRFFEHGEDEYVTWPASVPGEGDDISISGMGGYTVSEARALAASLLAASIAAEVGQ